MSYHISQKSILNVKSFLDQMVSANTDLEWEVTDASKTAYSLRQAIKSAQIFGLENYAGLYSKYKINRPSPTKVVAELRNKLSLEVLKQATSKMVLREIETVDGIVGAAIQHHVQELVFPDAKLIDEDMKMLHNYTLVAGNLWIVETLDGLTLSRKKEAKEVAWTPKS